MKTKQKQIELFLVFFDMMTRKLNEDLKVYRAAAIKTMMDHDLKILNLDDPKEAEQLAKKFFLHRIEGFNGYQNAGDAAIDEAQSIVNNSLKDGR